MTIFLVASSSLVTSNGLVILWSITPLLFITLVLISLINFTISSQRKAVIPFWYRRWLSLVTAHKIILSVDDTDTRNQVEMNPREEEQDLLFVSIYRRAEAKGGTGGSRLHCFRWGGGNGCFDGLPSVISFVGDDTMC